MSAAPEFSMQQLLEAGVHFGHKTRRWNPRMAPFIYGARNDIHIIDLNKTVPLLHNALKTVQEVCSQNGRILFVGTKRQAQDPIREAATRCGQYYIDFRWLGGLLTNWRTIQNSIKKLRDIEAELEKEESGFTKKELLKMERQRDKLEASLGGIKDMGGLPNLIFVVDTNREDLAVAEAKTLGIPVVGIVDTNSSYEDITYPVPGNDDSTRAIRLYCELIANAALAGLKQAVAASGADLGAAEEAPAAKPAKATKAEASAEETKATEAAEEKKAAKKGGKKAPVVEKKPSRKKAATKAKADSETKGEKPATKKKAPAKKKAAAEDKPAEEAKTEAPAEEKPADSAEGEKKAS